MKKFIVLFAVLAMVFGFTAQAMADMDAYGSIRFRTYHQDTDKKFANTPHDVKGTMWNMGLLSRLGFNFTTGDVGGKWEIDTGYNLWHRANTDSNRWGDIRVRHAYGYWNFGSGQLLIGQTGSPIDLFVGSVYWTGNVDGGWGALTIQDARPMQLRLTFGDLKLAFITPYTNTSGIYAGADATDVTYPKIELAYTLPLDNIRLDFVGGYQTYEDRISATDKTKDLDAWVVGARVKANYGAFYVGAVASYAQNARQYGLEYTDNLTATAVWHTNGIQDATSWAGGIALGYKMSDTVYLSGGYYMADSDNDSNGAIKYEDSSQAYYANCKVKLAPNVFVIPEITVTDRDEVRWGSATKTDQGKQTTMGVFWMINFK